MVPSVSPGLELLPDDFLRILRERIRSFAALILEEAQAQRILEETLVVLNKKPGCAKDSFEQFREAVSVASRKTRAAALAGGRVPGGPEEFRGEVVDRVLAVVPALGFDCRKLLRLKLEGKTYPEIRELLGLESVAAVYARDRECRKRLLAKLGGRYWGEV